MNNLHPTQNHYKEGEKDVDKIYNDDYSDQLIELIKQLARAQAKQVFNATRRAAIYALFASKVAQRR